MLYELFERFIQADKPVLFTHAASLPLLRRYFKIKLGKRFADLYRAFDDNDLALEWCEDRLLDKALPTRASRVARPKDYELFAGFTREELGVITKLLKRQGFRAGEVIIRGGDQAREMFFLARGGVSVFTPEVDDERKRIATFSSGMVFGEMAAIDRCPRSAMIVADTDVECDVLMLDDLDHLDTSHPGLKIKLLMNLNLCLCRRLRTVNRKLSVFG
jgi:CRP-like cAMP-binding protein